MVGVADGGFGQLAATPKLTHPPSSTEVVPGLQDVAPALADFREIDRVY
jgi:hypothetical protein